MDSNRVKFFHIVLRVVIFLTTEKVLSMDNTLKDCNKQYFGGRLIWNPSTLVSKFLYGGTCRTQTQCICLEDGYNIYIHCEGTQDVNIEFKGLNESLQAFLTIHCNATLLSSLFEISFYEDLHLNVTDLLKVKITDCPEPTTNYTSLSKPKLEFASAIDFPKFPVIDDLHIECIYRKSFSVERIHFFDFYELKDFSIVCPVLSGLPSDLFDGMKNLQSITIEKSSINIIPKDIFSGLQNLQSLHLSYNQIKHIHKDAFLGLEKLNFLFLVNNYLTILNDDIFYGVPNLTHLWLDGNNLSKLPNSISKLWNLEFLSVDNNSLKNIHVEYCPNITVMKNNTKEYSGCFPTLINAEDIYLSGNQINNLPFAITTMDHLNSLKLSHNSGLLNRLNKFLTSNNLRVLEIKNSSILSVDFDFLSGFPLLYKVDFSMNKIANLTEELFFHNYYIKHLDLSRNNITSLSSELFYMNSYLEYVDLSFNKIKDFSNTLFDINRKLQYLNFSHNNLRQIPLDILDMHFLYEIDFSFNNITDFQSTLFGNSRQIKRIDFSSNKLTQIHEDSFENLTNLAYLNLSNNKISSIEGALFKRRYSLEILDLSNNLLMQFSFTKLINYRAPYEPDLGTLKHYESNDTLKEVYLDGNLLTKLEILNLKNTEILSLSRNKLAYLILPNFSKLKKIKLSHNSIEILYLPKPLLPHPLEIDLSYNGISFCNTTITFFKTPEDDLYRGFLSPESFNFNFSSNNISFQLSGFQYKKGPEIWGRTTPFPALRDIQALDFSNNSIEHIFLDWRSTPSLRLVDLRRNKLKFLREQDLLFENVPIFNMTCVIQNDSQIHLCKRNLTLDLRENLIEGIELPSWHLVNVPFTCNRTLNHSHATILLDHNPFRCGLGVLNFLRYVEKDATLLSEVQRRIGENMALPAKIFPGNLTCAAPEMLKGKIVMETETYFHHLMPMVGLCALRRCDIHENSIEDAPAE